MTNRKNTRRALVLSLLSLLLCCSMLVGTTFAWFTDSVTSGNNKIIAGNLDVELYYKLDANADWARVTSETELFDDAALWEPGYTQVVYLKVVNEGTLALKYQLGVNITAETQGKNVDGDMFKLSDYIEFEAIETAAENFYANRDAAREAVTNSQIISTGYGKASMLYPNGKGASEEYVALVVYMPEETGNVANYRAVKPEITLGVDLVATQLMAEEDSFGPDYDEGATFVPAWDGTVTDPADLEKDANGVYQLNTAADLAGFAALVNGGNRTAKAVLNDDINLGGKEFKPIGGVGAGQSGWDSWFNGQLDGQGNTIYGLKVTEAPFAGLIGLSYSGTVKNLNIDGAHIVGGSYASGIVGYGYNTVINCKVTNSSMVASYAAPIVSYRGASVQDCVTANNTVVGWYVAGGVVGLSGAEPGTISGNTSMNNQIYLVDYKPTTTYRGAGDIVGCATNAATLQNNSYKDNVVEILPYSETTVIANAVDLLEVAGTTMEGNLLIMDDIDLNGAEFATIGAAYGKELNVIGNGYTISDATLAHTTHNGMKHYGLFYVYTNNKLTITDLTVKNVNMDGSDDTERNYGVGVIVAYADGGSNVTLNNVDVYNCTVKNDKPELGDEAGVYVGYQTGTLTMVNCDSAGCSVAGETAEKTGAFIGMVNGTATLTGCTTDLTIGACNRVGGTLTVN